jgi:hypothetical protein
MVTFVLFVAFLCFKSTSQIEQLNCPISSVLVFMSLVAPIQNLPFAGHTNYLGSLIMHIQCF